MFFDHRQSLLKDAILLLNGYIDSEAIINEVVRALQKDVNFKQEIVPFAIAAVKWKLGQSGMA